MRRTDREVTDPTFFKDVFNSAELITVAFNDGEYPYCVPLNFVELDGALYFHCAPEGHKLDCIARDPHIHFNTCDSVMTEKVKATAYYRSVSGTGLAEIVEEEDMRITVFRAIMQKYTGREDIPEFKKPGKALIVKINVTSLTGKQHARP